jgi:ABC-type lipoprotein release transport system permease subunit
MENSKTVPLTGNKPLRSSLFSLWLSWRELSGRRVIFSINVILIAMLIALPVALDLMGSARKSSVESRIDYLGPSLILVPQGIISSDLVTAQFRGKTFSSSFFNAILGYASSYVRNAEERLTLRLGIEGRDVPAVGIDFQNVRSYPFARYSIGAGDVLLGAVASEKMKRNTGDSIRIGPRTFTVAGVIPTAGGIDDVSVFLSLPVLQELTDREGKINEIRLFPGSLSAYEELKPRLRKRWGELNLIDAYRGDTAEKDIDTTLGNYQKALYTVAFILIALCIMISTYINLDGRRAEISTVHTMGATQGIILQVLAFRTVWITLLGSVIGQLIAILVTALQDNQVPLPSILSAQSFLAVMLGTVCLGRLVTAPFALYSVYRRDAVSYL